MVIYPHENVADDDKVNILVKFNGESIDATGVSRQLFNADGGIYNNSNRISTTPFSGKIDTSKLAGGADLAATQITAVQGYGITLNKNFDVDSAVDLTSGSTTRAAKKAAKKAAKAAKSAAKATKKTGEKATTETPVVQEIAEQVAEIAELTEIADLAEMTEIAELEKLTATDQVAMILPKTANVEAVQVPVQTVQVEEVSPVASAAAPRSNVALWIMLCAFMIAGCAVVVMKKRVQK